MPDDPTSPWPWVDVPDPVAPSPDAVQATKRALDQLYADPTVNWSDPAVVEDVLARTRASLGFTPPPVATPADAAKAKLAAIEADPSHPSHAGDPAALDEKLRLYREVYPDPTPPETPPREPTDANRPHLAVPPGTSAEDTQSLQDLALHMGPDFGPTLQGAIDRAVARSTLPLLDDEQLLDAQVDDAIRTARRRFGPEYDAMRAHVGMARALLRDAAPAILDRILDDPRLANDVELFAAFAHLGRNAMTYYRSKYGTSRAPRF